MHFATNGCYQLGLINYVWSFFFAGAIRFMRPTDPSNMNEKRQVAVEYDRGQCLCLNVHSRFGYHRINWLCESKSTYFQTHLATTTRCEYARACWDLWRPCEKMGRMRQQCMNLKIWTFGIFGLPRNLFWTRATWKQIVEVLSWGN